MKAYSLWFPDVNPLVLGCDDITMTNAIRSACIEYCEKTRMFTYKPDAVETVANTAQYDLDLPSMTNSVELQKVWIEGQEIKPMPIDMQGINDPTDTTVVEPGRPTNFFCDDFNTLTLFPTPDDAYTLTYRVCVTPSKTSTMVDDFVYVNFWEEISWGALYRIMQQPGRAYTNAKLAVYYEAKFKSALGSGKIVSNKTRTRGQMQAQFRPRA